LITFGAKTEVQPWGINKLPIMTAMPTLVIAIDVGHGISKTNQSVMSISAVLNMFASRYHQTYMVATPDRSDKDWRDKLNFNLDSKL